MVRCLLAVHEEASPSAILSYIREAPWEAWVDQKVFGIACCEIGPHGVFNEVLLALHLHSERLRQPVGQVDLEGIGILAFPDTCALEHPRDLSELNDFLGLALEGLWLEIASISQEGTFKANKFDHKLFKLRKVVSQVNINCT